MRDKSVSVSLILTGLGFTVFDHQAYLQLAPKVYPVFGKLCTFSVKYLKSWECFLRMTDLSNENVVEVKKCKNI
jgi:hypothetical protein